MKRAFEQYLRNNSIWKSQKRIDYVMNQYFRGLTLTNRSVLEIGAGAGVLSAWCAINGAAEVVAIEPEDDGSTSGVGEEFKKLSKAVHLVNKVKYLSLTFQDYFSENRGKKFDYLLMNAVINHLNERATEKLHLASAEEERNLYREIFRNMYSILKPGGVLLIFDVGRYNFWHDLKLKNPFTRSIEYEKHQQPKVWKNLLEQSGFKFMDILWCVPVKLRKLGRFLCWWLPSYFTISGFILRCKKGDDTLSQ